jgi:uncharacterized protein YcgI (DUF1989 family)
MRSPVGDPRGAPRIIPPATGIRLELARGHILRITDLEGGQVADLMAVSAVDPRERLCSGRTLDSNGTLFLSTGHTLYSNRGNALLSLMRDTAGRHDFLHAACSQAMFAQQYGATAPHANCLANLAACLQSEALDEDQMPTPFNVFMRVDVDAATGRLDIRPPSSAAGAHLELRAERDLVVAVTACAAARVNQGRLKPIAVTLRGPAWR